MKFIATLALAAAAVNAVTIDAEADQKAASSGYSGPIVPEDYGYAVKDFNMDAPFTDQECYQKQVDIYSDQIIAIEALRLEVLQLTQRMSQAEHDYEVNAEKIAENKQKIAYNSRQALDNKAKIDVLNMDVDDIAQCLSRQWSEQGTLRHVLELYCHQFTYVAHLPYQCEAILGAGSHLSYAYAWPGSNY